MKKIFISLLFLIFLAIIALLLEKKAKQQEESETSLYSSIELDNTEKKMLEENLNNFQNKLPSNPVIMDIYHSFSLKDSNTFLEYIESKGIGYGYNLKTKTHFISPPEGWVLPEINYFPIYINKSEILTYDRHPIKQLYIPGSYNAKYYPLFCKNFLKAIIGYGPQNPSKMCFFIYKQDTLKSTKNNYCYSFRSKESVSHVENPIRGHGYLWIDKKHNYLKRIKFNNIYYTAVTHGVKRNFSKLPTYNIEANLTFQTFNKFNYFKKTWMKIRYVRNEGVGRYPRRPDADNNKLIGYEIMEVDSIFPTEVSNIIKMPPPKINYKPDFWEKHANKRFHNYNKIKEDLSSFIPLEKQFKENNGAVIKGRNYSYSKPENELYTRLKKKYDSILELK